MATHEDKQLVAAAQKDKQKFAALYDKYFDNIYRYVYRRVRDKDTVHDIVSQTFYDALSHLDSYEWRGYPFSSWLYKIAHNNVLKWYRKQEKRASTDVENLVLEDDSVDLEKSAKQSESRATIEEAMEHLEIEDREIIRLKFFEEASNIEIADIMGLSANHIGVKVFRALKKLKHLLAS